MIIIKSKYRSYKEFPYKGRKIKAQKTGVYSTGNNSFTFRIRTKGGKHIDSFHIFEKDYTTAKIKAKKYMNEHTEVLMIRD